MLFVQFRITAFAPRFAAPSAIAAPRPVAEPVTRMIFPSKSRMVFLAMRLASQGNISPQLKRHVSLDDRAESLRDRVHGALYGVRRAVECRIHGARDAGVVRRIRGLHVRGNGH